jgi:hypothetical protein
MDYESTYKCPKKYGSHRSRQPENAAVGIRHADHMAPSVRKSWH